LKNEDFKISSEIIWLLVIGNFLLTIVGALAKIQDWEFYQIFLTVGLTVFFTTWIIMLSDMIKNKIHNKTFWVLTMFILPTIAIIFYLIQRNKLLKN
jgi:hypothetical protein